MITQRIFKERAAPARAATDRRWWTETTLPVTDFLGMSSRLPATVRRSAAFGSLRMSGYDIFALHHLKPMSAVTAAGLATGFASTASKHEQQQKKKHQAALGASDSPMP